ncbi:MAG: hypothetical protein WD378_09650, partial [Egicoccus sp.]
GGIGGLAIVAVAIALAAAKSRGDLGGLLAVPVGLIPAAALVTVIDGGIPLVLPWPTILVVAVGVPLVACLGSVVASRRDPGVTRAA